MIAGAEQRQERAGGGTHAAGEQYCSFGAVQRGQATLHRLRVGGIAISRVAQSLTAPDLLYVVHRIGAALAPPEHRYRTRRSRRHAVQWQ